MIPSLDILHMSAAGHSLALKLHFVRFRLLIVEPCQLRCHGIKSITHDHKIKLPTSVGNLILVGVGGFEPPQA